MLFRMIYDEALAHASYLIGCQRTGQAIVFDPPRDVDRVIALAAEHGLKITATAETHIHADFLSGCGELARHCGAHVFVSGEGGAHWQSSWVKPYTHTLLNDGDTFAVGTIRFKAIHTPGHTPEHLMYEVTNTLADDEPLGLLTGDFVFVGGLGRPDLLETELGIAGARVASARDLHGSALQFMQQPGDLQVWPAHGAGSACGKSLGSVPQSTVGYERRTNPSLAHVGDEANFIDEILAGQPDPPLYFARMKQLNRDGVPPLDLVTGSSLLSVDQCESLDLDTVTVVDTRDWSDFKTGHARGAIWTAPGPWFPAAVGSYLEPDQDIVLLVEEAAAESHVRLFLRLGLDRIVGVITPSIFEDARTGMDITTADEIDVTAFQTRIDRGAARILDVRSIEEYRRGHLPGAVHVPWTRLAAHLEALPPADDEPLHVHCQGGLRSAMAMTYLTRRGHHAVNIAGGYAAMNRPGGLLVP
jgi:hydroxyacylglutathione hydrolase